MELIALAIYYWTTFLVISNNELDAVAGQVWRRSPKEFVERRVGAGRWEIVWPVKKWGSLVDSQRRLNMNDAWIIPLNEADTTSEIGGMDWWRDAPAIFFFTRSDQTSQHQDCGSRIQLRLVVFCMEKCPNISPQYTPASLGLQTMTLNSTKVTSCKLGFGTMAGNSKESDVGDTSAPPYGKLEGIETI